jgi:hypothetical protein
MTGAHLYVTEVKNYLEEALSAEAVEYLNEAED